MISRIRFPTKCYNSDIASRNVESPALIDSPTVFTRHLNMECFESAVPSYALTFFELIFNWTESLLYPKINLLFLNKIIFSQIYLKVMSSHVLQCYTFQVLVFVRKSVNISQSRKNIWKGKKTTWNIRVTHIKKNMLMNSLASLTDMLFRFNSSELFVWHWWHCFRKVWTISKLFLSSGPSLFQREITET